MEDNGKRQGQGDRDLWLIAILLMTVILCGYQLDWGLPNGNKSWAADSLGPLTVLNIVRKSFAEWNSGWFYFKYPVGYPFLLTLSYLPYLACLKLTGGLGQPTAQPPHGFADLDEAAFIMALIGRALNVALTLGLVAITYDIGRRLFGRRIALIAAFLVPTANPIIYYAHTTNLYSSSAFWLALTVWATVHITNVGERAWHWFAFGLGAAMAVSTKEQDLPFLLPLPFFLYAHLVRTTAGRAEGWQRWLMALRSRNLGIGLFATALTWAAANNLFYNPSGAINRIRNLMGEQFPEIGARLTPVDFRFFKGFWRELDYVGYMINCLESALGLPFLLLSLVGTVLLVRSNPRIAVLLLSPLASYYYFALRTHYTVIALRYVLPVLFVAALLAALASCRLMARARRVGAFVVGAVCLFGLARAIEMDFHLATDARYRAERWIGNNMPPGSVIEVYQPRTYLPRENEAKIRFVPMEQRTVEGLRERRPDYVMLSSASIMSVNHFWNPDFHTGSIVLERPEATAMLEALGDGADVPYRQVAHISGRPLLFRSLITSLCPELTIYERAQEK